MVLPIKYGTPFWSWKIAVSNQWIRNPIPTSWKAFVYTGTILTIPPPLEAGLGLDHQVHQRFYRPFCYWTTKSDGVKNVSWWVWNDRSWHSPVMIIKSKMPLVMKSERSPAVITRRLPAKSDCGLGYVARFASLENRNFVELQPAGKSFWSGKSAVSCNESSLLCSHPSHNIHCGNRRKWCLTSSRHIGLHKYPSRIIRKEAINGVTSGLIKEGDFVTWRAHQLYKTRFLKIRITKMERPSFLKMKWKKAILYPFVMSIISNRHKTEPLWLISSILNLPYGFTAGKIMNRLHLTGYLKNLLQQRNKVIKDYAEKQQVEGITHRTLICCVRMRSILRLCLKSLHSLHRFHQPFFILYDLGNAVVVIMMCFCAIHHCFGAP